VWLRDLAVASRGKGETLTAQGDLAGALQSYRAALGITERLAAADPSNTLWQRDLSRSNTLMRQNKLKYRIEALAAHAVRQEQHRLSEASSPPPGEPRIGNVPLRAREQQ
jgi:hypothetical protein